MANIVIDPVIIVTPADDADRATVEVWLENSDYLVERSPDSALFMAAL